MCGIAGAIGRGVSRDLLNDMAAALKHRGPDAEDFYFQPPVGFAHRRLSIIDLAQGRQPMSTSDGVLTIVFNGEIYNYCELKKELEGLGQRFLTNSDTEVILGAYRQWGKECLDRFIGMFAFALWDNRLRQLWLVRDRLGKKPLYYRQEAETFYFASQAKALWAIKNLRWSLDPVAVDQYLNLRFVPSLRSLFKEALQLGAGQWMIVDEKGSILQRCTWWQPPRERVYFDRGEGSYREEFHSLFKDAVRLRLVADVPVGVFLSSGIDSYAVAREVSTSVVPVCFTISVDPTLDETAAAKELGQGLAAAHHVVELQSADFNLMDRIAAAMDEPYGDAIILPTYILARETARQVKAVLSGDGADEIMGAYVHHRALNKLDGLPSWARRLAGRAAALLPWQVLDRFFDYPAPLGVLGKQRAVALLREDPGSAGAYRLSAQLFDAAQREGMYTAGFKAQLRGQHDELAQRMDCLFNTPSLSALDKAVLWDLGTWFPQQTLMKLDRLTMMHGLEARCPFADHRLVDFFCRLPRQYLQPLTENKAMVREIYGRDVPALAKRKKPFYLPMNRRFKAVMERLRADATDQNQWEPFGIFSAQALSQLRQRSVQPSLLGEKQLTSMAVLLYWLQARRSEGVLV